MPEEKYLIGAVALMMAITYFTRATPLLFRMQGTPKVFNDVIEYLPVAIIASITVPALLMAKDPELDLWSTAKPYLERWMRQRMSPKALLGNLHSQAEQLPHLANMTRDLLERLSQPHLHDPKMPERRHGDHWALRLLGAGLLGGGVILGGVALQAGSLAAATAWPAWLMLAAGLYLIVRQ